VREAAGVREIDLVADLVILLVAVRVLEGAGVLEVVGVGDSPLEEDGSMETEVDGDFDGSAVGVAERVVVGSLVTDGSGVVDGSLVTEGSRETLFDLVSEGFEVGDGTGVLLSLAVLEVEAVALAGLDAEAGLLRLADLLGLMVIDGARLLLGSGIPQ